MTANRTITELYQALRPLLLRDVAIAASGSRASSGGMETHALNSNWHTGQLAETQAPWAATKNEWATALATHAALPDVHHAAVTAGTLIALSGQQVSVAGGAAYQFIGTGGDTAPEWRNVSELAGNGLTHTNGVLAVGVSGLGLSVGADAVALASSSNPGAAASILATDASGYLQLVRIGLGMAPTKSLSVSGDAGISGNVAAGSLSVTGAATVGQDFTVGANVLYVNQAGTRVGINRAPDQQFDLDVAGAIRGQYLIGRHAIQLASAIGVWHYDGSAPYNLDYTGSNASHMGASGTENGSVIYRPGKFGKAAQLAEATTNLITNPSFEVNTTGWTIGSGAGLVTTGGKYGANYLWSGAFSFTTATVTNGQQYTVSFWHRGPYSINVDFGNGTLNSRSASAAVGSDGWGRYTETFTANGSAFRLFLYDYGYDAVQLEQKAYATPYCDGSLGGGHSWSGTAHASSSSRLNAEITYSGALLSAAAGTLMFWADTNGDPDARMSLNCGGITGIWFILDPGNNQEIYVGAQKFNLSNAIASGWNHWALSWSATANEVKLFQNGVQIGTTQTYSVPTLGATLAANGFYGLDELVILDYAADAKLIRAIYESDAPVFVESSVFHWRAPSRVPIWVDEFGLWARGVSGNEILGLYGGDPRNPTGGVTKSWGGVTMAENDVLIGRAAGGYVFWDDSAQTMNLKGAMVVDGNSYFNGVVTIAAGGELRQGTGTIGSNYTGLRIWRDGDIGRIGGYSANTLQWYAGTDGVLYAGAGRVVLDGTGIAVQASSGTAATAQYAYRILESGANDGFEGGLYAFEGPSNVGQYIQLRAYNPDNPAYISILAETGVNTSASIELTAKYSSSQSRIYLDRYGVVEIDGMTYFDSPLTLDEVASTPSSPSSSNQARIYIRNDNLIVQWNDGGTIRYKYMALSGTGTTWTHATTAP